MDFSDNGKQAWEVNAQFWDTHMGDDSNSFHNDLVIPATLSFLELNEQDHILEIGCGNGNFASRLAKQKIFVTAIDYSEKMIALAKQRRNKYLEYIDFQVCDATNKKDLLALGTSKKFTKIVSNMVVMDLSQITPLLKSAYELLEDNGYFVFTMHHPCFTYPNEDYFTNCIYFGEAISGQPSLQNYYHRSLTSLFQVIFACHFVLDRFVETPFKDEKTPIIMSVRIKKCKP